jgi:hypothetical protein
MRAIGDKAIKARFSLGHRVRCGEADGVEAALARLRDQRGLDLCRIG